MKTRKFIMGIIAIIALSSCGGSGSNNIETPDKTNGIGVSSPDKPLNISIYLDLSDRLKRNLTPSQKDRDLAIVGHVADYFRAQTVGPKILQSKNNIKVLYARKL